MAMEISQGSCNAPRDQTSPIWDQLIIYQGSPDSYSKGAMRKYHNSGKECIFQLHSTIDDDTRFMPASSR